VDNVYCSTGTTCTRVHVRCLGKIVLPSSVRSRTPKVAHKDFNKDNTTKNTTINRENNNINPLQQSLTAPMLSLIQWKCCGILQNPIKIHQLARLLVVLSIVGRVRERENISLASSDQFQFGERCSIGTLQMAMMEPDGINLQNAESPCKNEDAKKG
jgi:hypothetical protein